MNRPTDSIDEHLDLQDALNTLPIRHRMVIFLYSQGMTQTEIAAELGCHRSNVSREFGKIIKILHTIAT